MRAFINRYPEPDKLPYYFNYMAMWLLYNLCDNLPTFLQKDGELDANSPFRLPLADVLPDPARCLTNLFSAFQDDEISLLPNIREIANQFAQNMLILSGLPIDEQSLTSPKLIRPEDYKGPDIIYHYTRGTPFLDFFETLVPFSIPDSVLSEHRLVVAATGTGKSQLIQADAYHYLLREHRPGIVIIDSQGTMLPKFERLDCWRDDLIIIDPEDITPPALNMFALPERIKTYDRNTREIIESTTIQLFGFLFAALDQTLTGRQATFFSFVTRLVLSIPGATIRTLREVLEEESKTPEQSQFWPHVQKLDPDAQAFFKNQFYQKGYNVETKRGIVQRLYGILRVPAFNRMFTATENKLDLQRQAGTARNPLPASPLLPG